MSTKAYKLPQQHSATEGSREMAAYLPPEILERIMVNLLVNPTQEVFQIHLRRASLVCRKWQKSATRILQGYQHLASGHSVYKYAYQKEWPLRPYCKVLELDFYNLDNSKKDLLEPFQVIDLVRSGSTRHIRKLTIKTCAYEDYSYYKPFRPLIEAAEYLRTLTIIHDTAKYDNNNHPLFDERPIPFLDGWSVFQESLSTKTHLKHLMLARLGLYTGFENNPAVSPQLPTIQFRLKQLVLSECVISDEFLDCILTSQIGSLKNLGLSRIYEVTKNGFVAAVIKVAPQLHGLHLNLLKYGWCYDGFWADIAGDDMRMWLSNGHPEDANDPPVDLAGASQSILPHCSRLHTLQLRDPGADTESFNKLNQLRILQYHLHVTQTLPLDSTIILPRGYLPKLEQMNIFIDDPVPLPTETPEAFQEQFKDATFKVEVVVGKGDWSCDFEGDTGYYDVVNSMEETRAIWGL